MVITEYFMKDLMARGAAKWRSHLPLGGDYGKPEGHQSLVAPAVEISNQAGGLL